MLMSLFSMGRSVIPVPLYVFLAPHLVRKRTLDTPDRRFMEEEILPCFRSADVKRVLFVGCRWYTRGYGEWFSGTQKEYWTTDIERRSAAWGARNRHIVCDVRCIDRYVASHFFDVVILNGVFGFGLDDNISMNKSLVAIHHVLSANGLLLIGWNRGLVPDPSSLGDLPVLFDHKSVLSLPRRKEFKNSPHVYDFFVAI